MLTFVYPADYFKPHQVDPDYLPEAEAALQNGFSVSTWDGQSLRPAPAPGTRLMYRGWMLTGTQYTQLYGLWASQGYMLKTSPEHYQLCHYMHRWYHSLQSYTPETHFIEAGSDALEVAQETLKAVLVSGEWEAAFVKDAVKSLKTAGGSCLTDETDLQRWFKAMQQFRQEVEWPICLRRWRNWQSESERRYFVYQGEVLAPAALLPVPTLVNEVAERIDSPFFSVDIILDEHDRWQLVEIGDGQVSGLTEAWQPEDFMAQLAR